MPGSARQLRLRPAAVALALGEAVELQDDVDVVEQQQCLDPAPQAAQAQCDYRLAQCLRLPPAGAAAALDTGAYATPLALDRSPNVICLEKYRQLKALGRI